MFWHSSHPYLASILLLKISFHSQISNCVNFLSFFSFFSLHQSGFSSDHSIDTAFVKVTSDFYFVKSCGYFVLIFLSVEYSAQFIPLFKFSLLLASLTLHSWIFSIFMAAPSQSPLLATFTLYLVSKC